MSILKSLKSATDSLHKEVEATPVNNRILKPNFTLEDYQALIQKNFYLHERLENSILIALQSIRAKDIHEFFNHKSEWLQKDLIGLKIAKENFSIPAPAFHSASEILGALYVIEGSMLGGKMIHRVLSENPNLSSIPAFNFFEGYGPLLGQKWRTFQTLAEKHIDNADQAIEAARNTFLFFKKVYNS